MNDRGYPTATPAPVENERQTTFLAVVGVQPFDDGLFDERPALVASGRYG